NWLPEYMDAPNNTPMKWTAGDQAIVVDDATQTRWVELETTALWPEAASFQPHGSAMGGTRLRGLISSSGAVAFETPAGLAWSRAQCAKLPIPSKAMHRDLWRSSVCARLGGRSLAWIQEQWRQVCVENSRPHTEPPLMGNVVGRICSSDL